MSKSERVVFCAEKPELTPERQELVDKIITLLREQHPTFKEVDSILFDVSEEVRHIAYLSMRL